MRLLVIGSGGREHVVSRHLARSPLVERVYCAPGNPGMAVDGIQPVAISQDDHAALIEFARENGVDWAFVGPEAPLLAGLVDDFAAAGIPAFGPSAAAAQIEGSKEFAKELMAKYDIPTAAYRSFDDFAAARDYVVERGAPIVVKADGLAAGKGVVVALTVEEAVAALEDMLLDGSFGSAGARVVVEDFLEGEEFSLLAFVRGEDAYPMVIAQDHKRAYDGDQGPNTGGMGAYSPVPQIPDSMVDEAITRVLQPATRGMVADGVPFTGILYAGLIATPEGPKVIEFNARFGDPEAQVVLPRLQSDLAAIIDALLAGEEPQIEWDDGRCYLGVVVAADGYPGAYEPGAPIPVFDESVTVDYAGVAADPAGDTATGGSADGSGLTANGGRIYLVKASGASLAEAQATVYAALDAVDTSGTFYRSDIGYKAID